mgnify:CR=1 FL=1
MSDTLVAPTPPGPLSVESEYRTHHTRLNEARASLDALKPNNVTESVEIAAIRDAISAQQAELVSESAIVNATLSDTIRVNDTTLHLLQRTTAMVIEVNSRREADALNGETAYG